MQDGCETYLAAGYHGNVSRGIAALDLEPVVEESGQVLLPSPGLAHSLRERPSRGLARSPHIRDLGFAFVDADVIDDGFQGFDFARLEDLCHDL